MSRCARLEKCTRAAELRFSARVECTRFSKRSLAASGEFRGASSCPSAQDGVAKTMRAVLQGLGIARPRMQLTIIPDSCLPIIGGRRLRASEFNNFVILVR